MSNESQSPIASSSQPATQHIARIAIRSVLWVAVARYGHFAVSLFLMATLSRVLSPDDFGLAAMAAVVTGFVTILAEAGLASAVVQHPNWQRRELSTIFWWTFGAGSFFSIAAWVGAPLVGRFFGDTRLVSLVSVASIGFTLSASSRVPTGVLQRDMRFSEWAAIETASTIGSAVAALIAAFQGAQYWTLVIRELTHHLLRLVGTLWLTRWMPEFAFDRTVLREGLAYSSGFTAFSAINYWARSADNLLIGKFLGTAALGYYTRAYALMMYPLEILTSVINPVVHPLLQAHRDDRALLSRVWIQIARFIATLCFPLMASLAVVGAETMRLLWGPGWEPAVPVFRVLCIVGAVQPVVSSMGPMFLVCGRTRQHAILGAVNTVLLIAGFSLGLSQGGLIGTAWGYVAAYPFVAVIAFLYLFRSMLEADPKPILRAMRTPIVLAILCAATAAGIATLLRPFGQPALVFAATAVGCAVVWVLALRTLEQGWLRESVDQLPSRARGPFRLIFLSRA